MKDLLHLSEQFFYTIKYGTTMQVVLVPAKIKRYLQVNFPQVIEEINSYARHMGVEKFRISLDVMKRKGDKEFWLDSKIKIEGDPPDLDLIDLIGRNKEIKVPVIIDLDTDFTVEGRHRLAAGIKYNLPVPVVMLERD